MINQSLKTSFLIIFTVITFLELVNKKNDQFFYSYQICGWIVNCRAIYPTLCLDRPVERPLPSVVTEPTHSFVGPNPINPQPIKKRPLRSVSLLAGIPGFEPRLTESESAVLPLDDIPKTCFILHQKYKKSKTVFLFG